MFREMYDERSSYSAYDFLMKLIRHAPFPIRKIQTDNGSEFTNALLVTKSTHKTLFEQALENMGILYQRIRVATLRYNGKVERQHRIDQLRFYNSLRMFSLERWPRSDSELIAELIRYGDFSCTRLADETIQSLRTLTRFRSYLVDSIADLKRKVICVLDQVFPEYETLFSDVFGTTARELLLQYSSPAELEQLSVAKLIELLERLSRKKCSTSKAEKVLEAAKHSFGVTHCRDTFIFQLRALLNQMNFIEQQVADTEAEIDSIMEELQSQITTIPGIGPVLGAVILGEIGDIQRFEHPSKLVAYAGIDASVSQSGEFEGTQMHMSKRGSPYLRRALFMAARNAVNSDAELGAFFEKKRSEGKHYSACIGAVSRKLCFIIHAILSQNRPFLPKD